jgi:hypothetical protein
LTRGGYRGGVRRALLVVSALVSLAFAGEAAAEEVVLYDDEDRAITFDVRAGDVDVEWFAALLRAAPHADEISTVRIVLVTQDGLVDTCGREARGCYSRNVITVPAQKTDVNAHTLVHEYGHHVDASRGVAGEREPNGSSTWWRARGLQRLVQLRSVYRGYVRGWDRNIAEIFAEDYAQVARPGGPFRIGWLQGPSVAVREAILHDLGLGPEPAPARPPGLKPVSFDRRGTLAPRRAASVPFELLGPGRRVRATVTVAGVNAKGVRARLELRCDGRRISTRTLAGGMRVVSIDRPSLGPAERCTVTIANTGAAARRFQLTVTLSVAL